MNDSHLERFNETELDIDLLTTAYEVQTNWHVLTGAPCSGKTTLIKMLAKRGFKTLAETARQYIECELGRGRMLAEIFDSKEDERCMKDLQLTTEKRLDPQDIIFLDRALPDCLPFYRLNGIDPNDFLAECFHHRYASVFMLNRLPLELDGARMDNDTLAATIDPWLAQDYNALGYNVIRVPATPPQERLDFILETLSERELI
jgi:predicted ATPase